MNMASTLIVWRPIMDWAADLLYVGLGVVFFGLTLVFVTLCERV
jgi:hypothetical protein